MPRIRICLPSKLTANALGCSAARATTPTHSFLSQGSSFRHRHGLSTPLKLRTSNTCLISLARTNQLPMQFPILPLYSVLLWCYGALVRCYVVLGLTNEGHRHTHTKQLTRSRLVKRNAAR